MNHTLRPDEAADYLGTTTGTLGNWRMKGIGPAYLKQGRFVRYPVAELDRWIADNTEVPSQPRSA